MNSIIAAFDEHEHGHAALRWAAELARLEGAPLEVVNVFEPTYSEIAPDWMAELLQRRHEAIREVLADTGAVDAEIVVLHGTDPVAAITSHLAAVDASMIVMGATGSGGPGGLGASGPAHHLIQHSHLPVAVVRPGFEPISGGLVAVGVDGSKTNACALEFGERFAHAVSGRLHAVHAYDPIDDTFDLEPEGWHRHSGEIREAVGRVSAVDCTLYMAAGHPADTLMEHARREGAAAIVVGTRGRGGFNGLRVGRVPVQLVAHATCPVIVVPH